MLMVGMEGIRTPPLLSPLRYPGGKRRFARNLADIIAANLSRPASLVIEPFAGGAAVAIALLEAGYTENIALCDLDPLVGNFWKVVFGSDVVFKELRDWIATAPISLKQFHEVKVLVPKSPVEAAFKCLYLNRTSFSGVLHPRAGPIGGQRQMSAYTINCRFPRGSILQRLDALHALRGRVAYAGVRNYSRVTQSVRVQRFLKQDAQRVVWYLDPPFFQKADKLYNFTFDTDAHLRFRDFVHETLPGHWIVSYDDVPEARALWSNSDGISKASLTYSASAVARRGEQRHKRSESRELIMSSFFQHTPSRVISLRGNYRDRSPAVHAIDQVLSNA